MIHNEQYNITLEIAKLLNKKYRLPLDFCANMSDPIKTKDSLWIGAVRAINIDINKFNKYIKELSEEIIKRNIIDYKISVDDGMNIWYGI